MLIVDSFDLYLKLFCDAKLNFPIKISASSKFFNGETPIYQSVFKPKFATFL